MQQSLTVAELFFWNFISGETIKPLNLFKEISGFAYLVAGAGFEPTTFGL
jgi:hypothetical protein